MRQHPYQKLLERKRTWTSVATQGNARRVRRRLCAVHLPCDIWNYLWEILFVMRSPLKFLLAREILESNVQDEIKHDRALGYVADAWGVDPKAEREASHSVMRGQNILITLSQAMVAERAIFSSYYPSCGLLVTRMRTVSADISRDEQVHVATNSLVCREPGSRRLWINSVRRLLPGSCNH